MDLSPCKHIRVRNIENTPIDVELLIKSLENQYEVDIRSIPQWKELIKILYAAKHDLKTKIQNAITRKKEIIEKLYVQNYRDSPFVLTDKLARTANIWKAIELNNKKRQIVKTENIHESIQSLKPIDHDIEEVFEEESARKSTAHPNTEDVEPRDDLKKNFGDIERDTQSEVSIKLPVYIATNQHKYLSPLRSQSLTFKSRITSSVTVQDHVEEIRFTQTNVIRCHPEEIKLFYNSDQIVNERCVKLILTNCTNEWALIRFKGLSSDQLLRNLKIKPKTPVKLYAGLSKVYLIRFKLNPNIKEFESLIHFKICHSFDKPDEVLSIPLTCEYKENRVIYVSDYVHLPPVYVWQLRKGEYPSGNITIRGEDEYFYHLYVRRQDLNWDRLLNLTSLNSLDVQAPETESEMQRRYDLQSENTFGQSTTDFGDIPKEESISTECFVADIVFAIVDAALKSFILEPSYIYLEPHSLRQLRTTFTKAEYIGPHQCCYDLEFFNPLDNKLILTKTVQIFAEVLPHPIQIHPIILDMSKTPIKSGLCVDSFTIFNTHKFIPVTIKIKLTTKMKRLFRISPQETFITALSNASFDVSFCLKSGFQETDEDRVYFTIKIIVIGDKSVYKNVPPFFYELIIPCAPEFKQIYGKKYFDGLRESLDDDHTDTITELENSQSKA